MFIRSDSQESTTTLTSCLSGSSPSSGWRGKRLLRRKAPQIRSQSTFLFIFDKKRSQSLYIWGPKTTFLFIFDESEINNRWSTFWGSLWVLTWASLAATWTSCEHLFFTYIGDHSKHRLGLQKREVDLVRFPNPHYVVTFKLVGESD